MLKFIWILLDANHQPKYLCMSSTSTSTGTPHWHWSSCRTTYVVTLRGCSWVWVWRPKARRTLDHFEPGPICPPTSSGKAWPDQQLGCKKLFVHILLKCQSDYFAALKLAFTSGAAADRSPTVNNEKELSTGFCMFLQLQTWKRRQTKQSTMCRARHTIIGLIKRKKAWAPTLFFHQSHVWSCDYLVSVKRYCGIVTANSRCVLLCSRQTSLVCETKLENVLLSVFKIS